LSKVELEALILPPSPRHDHIVIWLVNYISCWHRRIIMWAMLYVKVG